MKTAIFSDKRIWAVCGSVFVLVVILPSLITERSMIMHPIFDLLARNLLVRLWITFSLCWGYVRTLYDPHFSLEDPSRDGGINYGLVVIYILGSIIGIVMGTIIFGFIFQIFLPIFHNFSWAVAFLIFVIFSIPTWRFVKDAFRQRK